MAHKTHTIATGGAIDTVFTFDEPGMNATVETLIEGAATTDIYCIEVDATENPGQDVTIRFWNDLAGNVTVGTTDAEFWVRAAKGQLTTIECAADPRSAGGPLVGVTVGRTNNDVSVACMQEKGGTSGATSPSGTVKVRIWVDAG